MLSHKLNLKMKSPTDKAGKGNFKSFNHATGQGKVHGEAGREAVSRKSTESRKRKRPQNPVKKQAQGGKMHHLQLIENDYFSSDDKAGSHLRNLTQKAAHSNHGGLGPW